ncbi:MAG: hypothetical protein ACLFWG_00295 [Longimicrobiales bacterium]
MSGGPYRYGSNSRAELEEAHPELALLFEKLIQFFDVSILEAGRDPRQQVRNVRRGASRTMDSRHIPRDGEGRYDPEEHAQAVDAAPYPVRWPRMPEVSPELRRAIRGYAKDAGRFYYMHGALAALAHENGVEIRHGVDWDMDDEFHDQSFDDLPHVELAVPRRPLRLEGDLLRRANEALRSRGLPEMGE